MDITQIQNLITLVIVIGAGSLVSLITGIYAIVRSGKMLPKELKGMDLSNRNTEVSIANQYNEMADRSAERALKIQERMDKLETDHDALKLRVEEQDGIMSEQNRIIEEQTIRLDIQGKQLADAKLEIETLICEINNYKIYNSALIQQIREQHLVPLEINTLPIEDCTKISKAKKK